MEIRYFQQGVDNVSYMTNNSYNIFKFTMRRRYWVYSEVEYLTSPPEGRGSSTHRVCLCVCLSVTILTGAVGT